MFIIKLLTNEKTKKIAFIVIIVLCVILYMIQNFTDFKTIFQNLSQSEQTEVTIEQPEYKISATR